MTSLIRVLASLIFLSRLVVSNEDAKHLLNELFVDYNPIVRPVSDPGDTIRVSIGLKLSQIADIDEKNQIMTTNVWLRHEWYDHKLTWNPDIYGNTTKINIPSSSIWLPDVVLYNNADGDYQITTKTKATIHYDGKIIWEPPMIYKSYCAINIEFYPFDIQDCYMKFGTWTFDGNLINLEHINKNSSKEEIIYTAVERKVGISTKLYTVEMGIDLSDYYQSVEWDILSIPAQKNIKYYDCCQDPYYDIYFNITIRRKTLFYTVNLIIPCVNISFLSVLVFYLPSDSGEKLTLGISILVALLVFYLLLIELIPPTSLVIPLLGKYLLFTLILVNLSILLTIFILNLHHRKPNTHKMPHWMKVVFIEVLPKFLLIERPRESPMTSLRDYEATMLGFEEKKFKRKLFGNKQAPYPIYPTYANPPPQPPPPPGGNNAPDEEIDVEGMMAAVEDPLATDTSLLRVRKNKNMAAFRSLDSGENLIGFESVAPPLPKSSGLSKYPKSIVDALKGIKYINRQMKKDSAERREIDDWKYVSMVIDRLLLWIFTAACLIGTFGILLQAPSIYDERTELRKPPII